MMIIASASSSVLGALIEKEATLNGKALVCLGVQGSTVAMLLTSKSLAKEIVGA